MNGSITVDITSAIPYAVESLLGLFGKDVQSQERRERLRTQMRKAATEASWIQCIGMAKPIPIANIYQPMRLSTGPDQMDFSDLLRERKDAIILAGPGRGKTTFVHWIYVQLLTGKEWTPMLYTLRWPSATEELTAFVEDIALKRGRQSVKKTLRKGRIALLVDGYDEVSVDDRKKVSAALRTFSSLNLGNFYLTCRTFYDIIDLIALRCSIDDFRPEDAIGYVRGFSKAYGARINPERLLQELEVRGLGDFASSPLMLALICILKSGPLPTLPRNTIDLISLAINTLTFRWDMAKGIARESRVSLDGEDGVHCLMRIAYHMPHSLGSQQLIYKHAREHMKLRQRQDVHIPTFLLEMAQWFGILIPVSELEWNFVHRTIHDFLAARYWVENGLFSPSRVVKWDARAAYAACRVGDATRSLVRALTTVPDVYAVSECLYNNAPFDPEPVSQAIVEHFDKHRSIFDHKLTKAGLAVETEQDIFSFSSEYLIDSLVVNAPTRRTPPRDLVTAYALAELLRRGKNLSSQRYNHLRLLYKSPGFIFRVKRRNKWFTVKLSDLSPSASNKGTRSTL